MTDTAPPSTPDYETLPDSRRVLPPTLDERVRDLEARHDSQLRSRADHEKRLRSVEDWPRRIVVAVVAGALGMIATVLGASWSLSSQLARTEAAVDALTARIERVEDRLDRMEDRTWQRVDTRTEE